MINKKQLTLTKPSVPPQLCVLTPPCLSSYIIQSVIRPTASQSDTLPANPLDETLTRRYRPTAFGGQAA